MKSIIALAIATSLLLPAMATAVYEVGDIVGDIQLTDLEEQPVALYDHLGDIVLLNFFTTWCAGCNEEAEILENDIWQVYQDRGVTVISIDLQEPLPLVQGWAAAMGVTYHIWMSPDWSPFYLFEDFGGIPYNTVIDRDLVLRYKSIGFDPAALIDMIETVLEEDEVAARGTTWSGVKSLFR